MLQKLIKSVNFFTPYVYQNDHCFRMALAHSLDAAGIAAKIVLPLLASKHIEHERELGFGLLLSAFVLPRLLIACKQHTLMPVALKVQSNLTADLHEHSFYQSYVQHAGTASGEFAQCIANNYASVGAFVPKFYGHLCPFIFEFVSVAALLLVKYGAIALVLPAVFAVYSAGMTALKSLHADAREKIVSSVEKDYGALLDSIARHKLAKQFNRVEKEKQIILPLLNNSLSMHTAEETIRSLANFWGVSVGYSLFTATMVYTFVTYDRDFFDVSSVFLLNYFVYNFAISLDLLTPTLLDIATSTIDVQKIIGFIKNDPSISDVSDAQPLFLERAPDIVFTDLKFSYPPLVKGEPAKVVLNGLNLRIKAGSTVAFVGKSGAGKSTIVQLLQRLYPVTEGCISIGGANIKLVQARSLYHAFAVVEQSTQFLPDSWYENIRYARATATEAQIVEVARLANLITQNEGASKLKNSSAGVGGHALSGGEKQRIAIARAILKGGLILILDEATSALDPVTEKYIQETLNHLCVGATTIIITHKLYLLPDVDQVFYLQDGLIAECGTCCELVKARGHFFQQLNTQLQDLKNGDTIDTWMSKISKIPYEALSSTGGGLLSKFWKPLPPAPAARLGDQNTHEQEISTGYSPLPV